MELEAVIQGMMFYTKRDDQTDNDVLHIFSDSTYVMDGITKWMDKWKQNDWFKRDEKEVKNKDLWVMIYDLNQEIKPVCHHIKGHDGNEENEKVDKLAVRAIAAHA